jgi:hypothetical protein
VRPRKFEWLRAYRAGKSIEEIAAAWMSTPMVVHDEIVWAMRQERGLKGPIRLPKHMSKINLSRPPNAS